MKIRRWRYIKFCKNLGPPINLFVIPTLVLIQEVDVTDLHSYRPISNLSFVFRILERVIDSRCTKHVNSCNLLSPF